MRARGVWFSMSFRKSLFSFSVDWSDALITEPSVLLFDEPSAGLDVITAKGVMDYIHSLRDEGRTVLFSTHVLWEAERLADRIGIIDRGRLVEEGTLEELRSRTGLNDLEDIFFSRVTANEGGV